MSADLQDRVATVEEYQKLFMKPIRQFEVDDAVLRKTFVEDKRPIENIKAIIYCYPDGQISLESDCQTINNIGQKIALEYSGWDEITDFRPLDEICDAFLTGEILKTRVVEKPYTGEYTLEGLTPAGVLVSANTSIGTKFNCKNIEVEVKREKIGLKRLQVDYNFNVELGAIKQILYGLTNIKILQSFEASFIESKARLRLELLPNIERQGDSNISRLNSEMLLCNIPIPKDDLVQQNPYDTSSRLYGAYSTWFQMLFTFSSGYETRDIYRVETTQTSNGTEKVVEYWSGGYSQKKSGLMVIQENDISKFIIQVANKVTFNIFRDIGLGLSLSWYIESFDTTMLSTQCLFLYTAIETLNSNFHEGNLSIKHNISENRPNKQEEKIRNIKDNLGKLHKFFNEDVIENLAEVNESKQAKIRDFNSVLQRVFQAFDSVLNMIKKQNKVSLDTFNNLLKNILIYYKVPYDDLFPTLDIKTVRDKLIHTGFYIKHNQEATEFYLKLRSLFIRIVLSILEYEGTYIESNPTAEHGTHGLIYKNFKRLD